MSWAVEIHNRAWRQGSTDPNIRKWNEYKTQKVIVQMYNTHNLKLHTEWVQCDKT